MHCFACQYMFINTPHIYARLLPLNDISSPTNNPHTIQNHPHTSHTPHNTTHTKDNSQHTSFAITILPSQYVVKAAVLMQVR
jgi:hypothetical protein